MSLSSVLAKAVERNLEAVTGAVRKVAAGGIEAGAAAAELRSRGPGSLVLILRDSDVAQLLLAVPDSLLAALPAPAAAATAWKIADRVADFLGLDAGGGATEEIPRARPALAYLKRYGEADADELAWRLSGRTCLRLVLGSADGGEPEVDGPAVYACVEDAAAARFERAIADDERYSGTVKAWALADGVPAAPTDPPPSRLDIRAPLELVLGSLFAPPRVACGKYVLETRFSGIAGDAARSPDPGPGTWASASCALGGGKWSAWYFFPAVRDGRPGAGAEAARGLAGCLFRDSLRLLGQMLRVAPEKPGIAVGPPPTLRGAARFAVLSAGVRAGNALVPLEVFVDYPTMTWLIRAFCDAIEVAQPQAPAPLLLPLMLSLNQSLLRRRLPALHTSFVETTPEGELFPFAAFIDLMPDRDVAIVMQNYVLRTLGKRSLRSVFHHSESMTAGDGRASQRLVTPFFVDEARLFRFLPQVARDAWDADRRVSAKVGDVAAFRAVNREILAGIHRAALGGSLLLSPRALYVLERMVLPRMREAALSSIATLAAAGVPFATLRELPQPRLQRVLATQPLRALCLSLLGAEAELTLVKASSSRTRGRRIDEDLALLRRRWQSGGLSADEVVTAMQALEAAAREALEEAPGARRGERSEARAAAAAEPERGEGGGERVRYKGWARPEPRPPVRRPGT